MFIWVGVFSWVGRDNPSGRTDFDADYFWLAGNAVWRGVDPYAAVEQAIKEGRLHYPFYYPGTAAVFMAPFGALPHHLGVTLFTAFGMGLLAWSANGWRRWIILSAPAFEAMIIGQWSPWMTAALGLPWLQFVWAAKPSVGLAFLGGWPTKWAVGGGVLLLAVSLIVAPYWPAEWLETLREAHHYEAPVQRLGGALLLLAFLRWRRPQARMLGILALVPHTSGLYELLPLLMVPQTKQSFSILMVLSWFAAALVYTQNTFGHSPLEVLDRQWPYFFVLLYVPALVIVLTEEGGVPHSWTFHKRANNAR